MRSLLETVGQACSILTTHAIPRRISAIDSFSFGHFHLSRHRAAGFSGLRSRDLSGHGGRRARCQQSWKEYSVQARLPHRRPGCGTVKIGGTDILRLELAEVRGLAMALFWEPVKYSETVVDSVSIAEAALAANDRRVIEAISLAGA